MIIVIFTAHNCGWPRGSKEEEKVHLLLRGVDVNKRTVTTPSCNLLMGIRFGHSCLFVFSFIGHILA